MEKEEVDSMKKRRIVSLLLCLAMTLGLLSGCQGGGASGGRLAGRRAWAVDLAACRVFIVVTYTCGCVQYAAVVGVDLAAAFAVTIAPFAIPDLVKAVAAVACARAVTRAVNAALAYAGEVQK